MLKKRRYLLPPTTIALTLFLSQRERERKIAFGTYPAMLLLFPFLMLDAYVN